MECLPRDIALMVHRYLFDSNYSDLKQQYRSVYCNDREGGDRADLIYWNDVPMCFATVVVRVAQWRSFDNDGDVIYELRPMKTPRLYRAKRHLCYY